jgi:spore coat polysaccharide biosynthesis protein SpsF
MTNIIATVEARMTSSRLPGKVLMPAAGEPLLGILIRRLKAVPELTDIVVATTINVEDDPIVELAHAYDVAVFRGDELDVLGRVSDALKRARADIAVEITGDCPLIDPKLVSDCIRRYISGKGQHRYVANTTGPQLGAPHGLDVQVFAASDLHDLARYALLPEEREHVSSPFYRPENAGRFRPLFVSHFPESMCRRVWISLDYPEDYRLIRAAHEELSVRAPLYGAQALIEFCLGEAEMTKACLARRGWTGDASRI